MLGELAPGGDARDGIYYEYCRKTGTEFFDFGAASRQFGGNERAFDGACQAALENVSDIAQLYDVILVDEAQDFSPSFLRLCHAILKPPKRLVYAYDELQNLSEISLPPPEEIFGSNGDGKPLVTFDNARKQDVILQKCYRNSRPVLVSAHGLGFGIYRNAPKDKETGLVQMFDYPALWEAIGYKVKNGQLQKGQHVVLERPTETSPDFLEKHSHIDDLVKFIPFDDERQQNAWLVRQIQSNLNEDELRHDDIIVIHPDALTARRKTAAIRQQLFDAGIQSHLAGIDTDQDVFFRTDTPSVTFTSIHRAKGNEAGMVYVVNAQDCNEASLGLARLRNQLFTAITRSKAWVCVIGYGSKMQELIDEFSTLKQHGFVLDFRYPDDDLLGKLRIVHRDLSPNEKNRLKIRKNQLAEILDDLKKGELHPEDFDSDTIENLKKFLEGSGNRG